MTGDFEMDWRNVREQVLRCCYRAAGNRDDGEDIFQQVALRAWRGYATFRGDCAFLSWVLAIAGRETARVMGRKSERSRVESSLDVLAEEAPALLPESPAPALPALHDNWLLLAVPDAVSQNVLTEAEANVVNARVTLAECSWDQIGALLNLDGGTCAVTYCRAIPKLRVFLFLNHADLLGGQEAISAAFDGALSAKTDPLNREEAEVFRRIVLNRRNDYRKPGWMNSLRAACGKVIRRLARP